MHTTGITPALSNTALAAQQALFALRSDTRMLSFHLNWRAPLWRAREEQGRAVLADFAHRADIVFRTRQDASVVVFGTDDPAALRDELRGPRFLIVTDPVGAVAFDGVERVESDALDALVVETAGAGDACAAGFLAGILTGLSVEGCLARAHRIATRVLDTTRDHMD